MNTVRVRDKLQPISDVLYECGAAQVKFWSQQISFWLVGCIVVTSIRGLLLTVSKVCTSPVANCSLTDYPSTLYPNRINRIAILSSLTRIDYYYSIEHSQRC